MVILTLLLFLTSTTHAASAAQTCPKCGSAEIPYPLSISPSCGNPSYRLFCNNGTLEFPSPSGFNYTVLSINPNASKLIVAPASIRKPTCKSADIELGGLRLDEDSPFNISTHNTVMLFNCSDNVLLSPMDCSAASPCRMFEEEVEEGSGCRNTLCCSFHKDASITSHMIRVRVGGCTAYTSVVDMKTDDPAGSWGYGVELQWLPPN
ncbi:hypothetical protein NMG60_11020850 [Bertholletia excelsa]